MNEKATTASPVAADTRLRGAINFKAKKDKAKKYQTSRTPQLSPKQKQNPELESAKVTNVFKHLRQNRDFSFLRRVS